MSAHVLMFARVAHLAKHARIDDEPHFYNLWLLAEPLRNVIGSTPSTFHSGSLETSSDSQRSSIAAIRAARSAISVGDAVTACFVGRGGDTIAT